MNVVSLNLGNYGSTGGIAIGIGEAVTEILGWQAFYAFPDSDRCKQNNEKSILLASKLGWRIEKKIAYYTKCNGMVNYFATRHFLKKLKKIMPAVLHFHNLHNSYIHLPLLFRFVKKHNISVIWTLHDCWSFTGHCPHFTLAKCDKWIMGCHNCPSYREYPESLFDDSKRMYRLKKKWFTGVKDMTLVTPSQWLADLVNQSFLKDYPVQVIHNGIDLKIFKPTPGNFRQKHNISDDTRIVLGVAFGWGRRKGLDVFIELAERLDSRKYQIVLVGTNDLVDAQLPENIISIHRTHNQRELAEIYTEADIFVNPTREDNFPTVNMEALACGTPVLTFATGGSPESIDESCGAVVPCDDVEALRKEIVRICEQKPYSRDACIMRAKLFDMNERFREYVEIYKRKQQ